MSNSSVSSLVHPSSSAAVLGLQTEHVCARHPEMRGERGCASCSAALCTACVRSSAHRHCPTCRQNAQQAPHVVDVGWRVHLQVDALAAAVRAVPRRAPALLGLLGLALFVPLFVYVSLSDGSSGDKEDWIVAAGLGGAFAAAAFFLGAFFQPLLVIPQVAPVSKRFVVGALLASVVAFGPFVALGGLAAAAGVAGLDAEIIGNLIGLVGMAVAGVSFGAALLFQGRAVMGRGPSLRGLGGTIVTHCVVVGIWSSVSMLLWLPAGLLVGLGAVVGVPVAAVCAVVGGVVCWVALLIGTGAFAAGAARYSADLEDLT